MFIALQPRTDLVQAWAINRIPLHVFIASALLLRFSDTFMTHPLVPAPRDEATHSRHLPPF